MPTKILKLVKYFEIVMMHRRYIYLNHNSLMFQVFTINTF